MSLNIVLLIFSLIQQSGNFEQVQGISDYMYLIDEKNQLEFGRVIVNEQFEKISSENPNFGIGDHAVWLKLVLSEKGEPQNKKYLVINNPNLDEVDFFQVHNGAAIQNMVSGRLIDFYSRIIPSRKIVFPLDFEFAKDVVVYLKIKSSDRKVMSVGIGDINAIYLQIFKENIFFGIFTGVLFGLLFYNLFLFFSLKDRTYLFYVAHIFFIWLALSHNLGFAQELIWPNWTWVNARGSVLFPAVGTLVAIFFVKDFLQTKVNLPDWDKGFLFIFMVFGVIIAASLSGLIIESYSVMVVAQAIVIPYVFAIAFIILKNGFKSARYFLIAWSVFMLGIFLNVLAVMGLIPFWEINFIIMPLGATIGVIFLSFALADRINDHKSDFEKEQIERLIMLEEHESKIIEQNEFLEEKVRQRTEQLELTLHNLQNTQIQLVNQEKMASLGQLTAGIAHEINNPINFVSSNISPLKRDIQDLLELVNAYREKGKVEFSEASLKELEQVEEDLEFDYILKEIDQLLRGMDEGAKRTVEIVKGLRLFSRVDEQDVKRVDIHDGINSTLILLNSSIAGKIQVIKSYENLPIIECLPGKINQVFMNIITNAIHALLDNTDKIAEPRITIRTRHNEENITVEIEDNGIGMPEHVKQRIFEPFFTTKAVGKGTGLGLSIVYTIIENHKGTLEVITDPGKGTNFVITLPIYQNTPPND